MLLILEFNYGSKRVYQSELEDWGIAVLRVYQSELEDWGIAVLRVYQSELEDWGIAVLLPLHLPPFWLLLLAHTPPISDPTQLSYRTRSPCRLGHHVWAVSRNIPTSAPSNNMLGTRPSSRMIRLLCGQVSLTAII